MAEYQKFEYRIKKDGKITEAVVNASGSSCIEATSGMEKRWEKWKAKNYYRSIMRATRT